VSPIARVHCECNALERKSPANFISQPGFLIWR